MTSQSDAPFSRLLFRCWMNKPIDQLSIFSNTWQPTTVELYSCRFLDGSHRLLTGRPWQRAVKSADWERTFALFGWFFPNYTPWVLGIKPSCYVIWKVILRAIILCKKILKTEAFVKFLKPSSFSNFQLFSTNKYISRKGLARETRFWNLILNFPNNKIFRKKSKIFLSR